MLLLLPAVVVVAVVVAPAVAVCIPVLDALFWRSFLQLLFSRQTIIAAAVVAVVVIDVDVAFHVDIAAPAAPAAFAQQQ